MNNSQSDLREEHYEFLQSMLNERRYQVSKWGHNSHTVGEWLLVAKKEMDEAINAWVTHKGEDVALAELVQLATVIMACFEEHDIVDAR